MFYIEFIWGTFDFKIFGGTLQKWCLFSLLVCQCLSLFSLQKTFRDLFSCLNHFQAHESWLILHLKHFPCNMLLSSRISVCNQSGRQEMDLEGPPPPSVAGQKSVSGAGAVFCYCPSSDCSPSGPEEWVLTARLWEMHTMVEKGDRRDEDFSSVSKPSQRPCKST